MLDKNHQQLPKMTNAGLAPTFEVEALDEFGEPRRLAIAGERPLTLYLDKREIVTLMTLGGYPEALAIGYLRNQGFIDQVDQIKAVQADWDVDAVVVTSVGGDIGERADMSSRTVTSGCGQGTVFGDLMERIDEIQLPSRNVRQSDIYALLKNVAAANDVYKKAGAVHGCALCRNGEILWFVEDVGRHNAVDAIAGLMWLHGVEGEDLVFYTTGRLTSEMVIKVAQMQVPLLLSRSGATEMGRELAEKLGVTMIARAKGKHFLALTGHDRLIFDAIPAKRRTISPADRKSE